MLLASSFADAVEILQQYGPILWLSSYRDCVLHVA
jgi:hypothetical protein